MEHVTSTGGLAAPAATSPPVKTSRPATTAPAFKDDLAKATERLQPVPHHGRMKIVGGARDGEYLNASGNKRDGQAFTMEYHGGRRWHVYGTGADRVVIPFAKPAAAVRPADGGATAKPATPAVPATSDQSGSFATPVTGGPVPLVATASATATDRAGTATRRTSA